MIRDRNARDELAVAVRTMLEARPEILLAYLHGSFAGDGPYRGAAALGIGST